MCTETDKVMAGQTWELSGLANGNKNPVRVTIVKVGNMPSDTRSFPGPEVAKVLTDPPGVVESLTVAQIINYGELVSPVG